MGGMTKGGYVKEKGRKSKDEKKMVAKSKPVCFQKWENQCCGAETMCFGSSSGSDF
jgi:hypothetical protein